MNDQLQQTIVNILQQAIDAATKGAQWLSGQIPDVIHQLIVWTIVKDSVCLLPFIFSTSVLYYVGVKKIDWNNWDHTVPYVGSTVFLTTVTGCLFCSDLLDLLKITLAPKLWLLEYAAALYKGH